MGMSDLALAWTGPARVSSHSSLRSPARSTGWATRLDVPRDAVRLRREVGGRQSGLLRRASAIRVRGADVAVQHIRHDLLTARGICAGAARLGGAADGHVLGRGTL